MLMMENKTLEEKALATKNFFMSLALLGVNIQLYIERDFVIETLEKRMGTSEVILEHVVFLSSFLLTLRPLLKKQKKGKLQREISCIYVENLSPQGLAFSLKNWRKISDDLKLIFALCAPDTKVGNNIFLLTRTTSIKNLFINLRTIDFRQARDGLVFLPIKLLGPVGLERDAPYYYLSCGLCGKDSTNPNKIQPQKKEFFEEVCNCNTKIKTIEYPKNLAYCRFKYVFEVNKGSSILERYVLQHETELDLTSHIGSEIYILALCFFNTKLGLKEEKTLTFHCFKFFTKDFFGARSELFEKKYSNKVEKAYLEKPFFLKLISHKKIIENIFKGVIGQKKEKILAFLALLRPKKKIDGLRLNPFVFFYGPPGTGKSRLLQCIRDEIRVSAYVSLENRTPRGLIGGLQNLTLENSKKTKKILTPGFFSTKQAFICLLDEVDKPQPQIQNLFMKYFLKQNVYVVKGGIEQEILLDKARLAVGNSPSQNASIGQSVSFLQLKSFFDMVFPFFPVKGLEKKAIFFKKNTQISQLKLKKIFAQLDYIRAQPFYFSKEFIEQVITQHITWQNMAELKFSHSIVCNIHKVIRCAVLNRKNNLKEELMAFDFLEALKLRNIL
jgi:hypothetical protein